MKSVHCIRRVITYESWFNYKADEVFKEISKLIFKRYQIGLETLKGSDFIFDCAHLSYYNYHKINLSNGGSYIDFPDWIKNKSVINTVNDDD